MGNRGEEDVEVVKEVLGRGMGGDVWVGARGRGVIRNRRKFRDEGMGGVEVGMEGGLGGEGAGLGDG